MTPKETEEIGHMRSQPWFGELERRVLEIWIQGEGDLRVEIRNNRLDKLGRRLKSVKIEGGAIYRLEEC